MKEKEREMKGRIEGKMREIYNYSITVVVSVITERENVFALARLDLLLSFTVFCFNLALLLLHGILLASFDDGN